MNFSSEKVELLNDAVRRRTISRFLTILIPTISVMLMTGILTNILGDFHRVRFIFNILMLIALALSFFYTRRGRLLWSIQIICASGFFIMGASVLFNGGVMVPNYAGFFVLMVIVNIFFTPRTMICLYIFSAIIGFISITWLGDGLRPETLPSPFRYWTIYTLYGLILMSVLYLNRSIFNKVILKLADQEALVSSAFASISEPLLVFDEKQQLVQMNPSAEMLDEQLYREYGVRLLDAPCLNLNSRERKSLVEQFDFNKTTHTILNLHLLLPTRQQWLNVTSSPHLLRGVLVGTVVFIRDITDQHYLVQAQKMSAVGSLASGIAHDFNNMLGAISNSTAVLSAHLGEEHHEVLEVLREATKRSSELTSQLLIFSRKRPHKMKSVDVHKLLLNITGLLQQTAEKNTQILLDLAAPKSVVRGNEGQLHSALMNLELNGIQAMPAGGQMQVRSAVHVLSEEDCALSPFNLEAGSFLLIEIHDTGIGIPPEVQSRIFEPFFTTKAFGQGTGLGLTAVYRLVETHGGAVYVNSTEGQGTTFSLYLPLDESLSTHEEARPSVPTEMRTQRILVIDDEPLVRRSLCRTLKLLGHVATGVDGGAAAMAILQSDQSFDLVILDMLMPEKNGDEVFYEIKALHSTLPVIISSGFAEEDVLSELKANNLSGILLKPYTSDELRRSIANALAT